MKRIQQMNHDRRNDLRMTRGRLRRILSLTLMMMLVINSVPFAGFSVADEPA